MSNTIKKPANQSNFHSSRRNRLLISLGFILVITLIYALVVGIDQLKVRSLSDQLGQLPVPSEWKRVSQSTTPHEDFWDSCAEYVDLTCPTAGTTYSVTKSKQQLLEQMNEMSKQMQKNGYAEDKSCLDNSCLYYSFSMTKDGYAVGALARESGGNRSVHIGVSKD